MAALTDVYLTSMQMKAVEAAVEGRVVSGATPSAQYQRLRRAAIRMGVHRRRAEGGRKTRIIPIGKIQ